MNSYRQEDVCLEDFKSYVVKTHRFNVTFLAAENCELSRSLINSCALGAVRNWFSSSSASWLFRYCYSSD
jgi:hypothetical protein